MSAAEQSFWTTVLQLKAVSSQAHFFMKNYIQQGTYWSVLIYLCTFHIAVVSHYKLIQYYTVHVSSNNLYRDIICFTSHLLSPLYTMCWNAALRVTVMQDGHFVTLRKLLAVTCYPAFKIAIFCPLKLITHSNSVIHLLLRLHQNLRREISCL